MDELAMELFELSSQGYCCTQIMLKMALDLEEKENPDLIRSASGLCRGIGGSQKTCGVVTGGIGILGLYAGKGEDQEFSKENYMAMVKEYMAWFEDEFDSMDCIDLIGVTKFQDPKHDTSYDVKCGQLIQKGYLKVMEILSDHGYEPGDRES